MTEKDVLLSHTIWLDALEAEKAAVDKAEAEIHQLKKERATLTNRLLDAERQLAETRTARDHWQALAFNEQAQRKEAEGERDAAVKQTALWKTLGDSVRADAASAAIFIAEYVEKFAIKHPPKQDEGSPHHWHSLVFRMGERITEAEATTRRLEAEAKEHEESWRAVREERAVLLTENTGLHVENRRLREALEAARLYVADAAQDGGGEHSVWEEEPARQVLALINNALAGTEAQKKEES